MSQSSGPRVYLAAAVAANGIIGAGGKLPWHLPEDLRHFKRLTLGHPVIMGRHTWESLKGALAPREDFGGAPPPGYEGAGAAVAISPEAAPPFGSGEPVAFVIGGTSLF